MLPEITLDIEGFRQNILRCGTPKRAYYFELAESEEIKDEIAYRFELTKDIDKLNSDLKGYQWRKEIAVQRFLGHEVFRVWLPGAEFKLAGSKGTSWGKEHFGSIQSWADIENYNWPDPKEIDYSQLEWYEYNLPEDMGVVHVTKIWEIVRELFGFENFCIKLYEDPHLIDEVIKRVGEFHMALTRILSNFNCVFAIFGGDDYGYKTSTMMAPKIIKDKFLPWHKKMAREAHQHNKLYFMHSCGKIDTIMDALIDDVKIDAKHSFEDVIESVIQAKGRWGNKVALLGGLDVDFVVRSDESAIRQRVNEVLDVCLQGGGYCLGLGNWVTSYIPIENYLTVLDEGRKYCY